MRVLFISEVTLFLFLFPHFLARILSTMFINNGDRGLSGINVFVYYKVSVFHLSLKVQTYIETQNWQLFEQGILKLFSPYKYKISIYLTVIPSKPKKKRGGGSEMLPRDNLTSISGYINKKPN